MPKSIIISKNEPDMAKMQELELLIDEGILDSIRAKTRESTKLFLFSVLSPQDDFLIQNKDINSLQIEIFDLLTNIENLNHPEQVFLHVLGGFCSACINTQCNLYGFAD